MVRNRPWTFKEVQFLKDSTGELTMKEMADELDRSYQAVRNKVTELRKTGEIDRSCRIYGEDHYISDLRVCLECITPREKVDEEGVCRVCRAKQRLEDHKERMYRAYDNLPRELQEKTNGTFTVQRAKNLMTKSKSLKRPKKPDTTGLVQFYAEKAMDDYYYALEKYELQCVNLDIDAVKQRRSKWIRKANKYRKEHQ